MAEARTFDANDVLVDQTMVCEAARLLARHETARHPYFAAHVRERQPADVERLLNLSLLLDGLALHEHLFVLDAEDHADAGELELKSLLVGKGILRELETASYAAKISGVFRPFLTSLVDIGKISSLDDLLSFNRGAAASAPSGRTADVETITLAVKTFLSGEVLASCEGADHAALVSDDLACHRTGMNTLQLLAGKREGEERLPFARPDLVDRPFYVLGKEMLRDLGALHSGRVGRGVSLLRTFIYREVAEEARIVLYPSCRRAAQIELLTDHLRAGIAEEVYRVVARAFETDVETVYADEEPVPLFLPPTLAVFLDIFQSTKDLAKTIDAFRGEFAALRRGLRELETRSLQARTIAERMEIKQKIVSTLGSLVSHYQSKQDATLETVISYGEIALKPLVNPLDPTKYSKELLLKPLGWIKTWWRDRPLRAAFDLRKRLHDIKEYEGLAGRALGLELDQEEKQRFYSVYDAYLALYERKRKPRAQARPAPLA